YNVNVLTYSLQRGRQYASCSSRGRRRAEAAGMRHTRRQMATMPARAAEPVDRPAVSISLLGTVSVAVFGRDIRIKNRKSRAVLAYVVLNEVLRETRERLVGLFWSESDEEKARGSLRQTLRELRALFDEAGYLGFRTDKLAIELDRHSI